MKDDEQTLCMAAVAVEAVIGSVTAEEQAAPAKYKHRRQTRGVRQILSGL